MKSLPALLLTAALTMGASHARSLDDTESQQLRTRVATLVELIQQGDAEALIEQTHPSIYKLAGSREQFEETIRMTTGQIATSNIRMLKLDIGEPSPLYPAGDEEVCFVPRTAIVEIEGRKLRSTTFMIAIRPQGGGDWRFLDGAGLRRNSQYIYRLLPKLPPDIPIPANRVVPLDPGTG